MTQIKDHILTNMKFDEANPKEILRILKELPLEEANKISKREYLESFGFVDEENCLSRAISKQKNKVIECW